MTERLLTYLRDQANVRGLAIAREERIIQELGVSREALKAALTALSSERAIRILSPLPFLVAKITHPWSSSSSSPAEKVQQIGSNPALPHIEVPVSSRAAAAATQQEDGGAGEGGPLLDLVLRVLGPDADRDEFRVILAGHEPAVVHRCLRRVQATRSIRVSRAALFRSLLSRLSQ